MAKLNISTDKFTKAEIISIEDSIKEWNYDWIVEIIYISDNKDENVDATFIIDEEDVGELLSVIFACGHEFALN